MKREKLRRRLAWAIVEELGTHKFTIPNVERYVIPKMIKYNIRKNQKITLADTVIALFIVTHVVQQNPMAFRYGVGELWTQQRKDAFMSARLPVK